jgi:hypothetical protein
VFGFGLFQFAAESSALCTKLGDESKGVTSQGGAVLKKFMLDGWLTLLLPSNENKPERLTSKSLPDMLQFFLGRKHLSSGLPDFVINVAFFGVVLAVALLS